MKLIVILVMMFTQAYAQHLSASLTKSGLEKVVISALETYSESQSSTIFTIPARTSHLKIRKEELNNYKIVKEIKEYGYIDLSEDFNFLIRWKPMVVEFELDKYKYDFDFNGDARNLDLIAKGVAKYVRVKGAQFEICETVNRKCIKDRGVYAKIKNFDIKMRPGEFIQAIVSLNLKHSREHVYVQNNNLISSLFMPKTRKERELYKRFKLKNYSPKLDIYFSQIIIPDLTLRVGDRVTTLDTSGLKSVILKNKNFLSKQLFHIVGKFISEDLSKEVTRSIIANLQTIVKKTRVFNFNSAESRDPIVQEINGQYVLGKTSIREDSFMESLAKIFSDMTSYLDIDLEYLTLRAEKRRSLTFDYDMSLVLNNSRARASKKILNGHGSFKKPNFSWIRKDYDLAIALGEPFLNSVLDVASDSGLLSEIIKEQEGMDGVKVKAVHIHYDQERNPHYRKGQSKLNKFNGVNTGLIALVAEVEVDLKKAEANTWLDRQLNSAAAWWEGKVWFPVEVFLRPTIINRGGERLLKLTLVRDEDQKKFSNRFGYAKKDITGFIEKKIFKKIASKVYDQLENIKPIPTSGLVKLPGLCTDVVDIKFLNSGHMALLLSVEDLELKTLVEYIDGKERRENR